ncbi:hypothetical protein PAPYR_4518 [Paratrimastix pyriformis]|uniref:Uncharacterized protein n=1 Tax=Paratrimastix pyriformis TaxID=342808 RepID=A0ABQ8UPL9_9EUKA|nr:hypothetical protein PAPYR_4518 [Paratrimastix pyriformis]
MTTGTSQPDPSGDADHVKMEQHTITLVLAVEGAKKRRVPFPRNAGFEALKSLIAREFCPESLVEISYMCDGDTFEKPAPATSADTTRVTAPATPPESAPAGPCANLKQIPNEQPPAPPLEPLPLLAMCALRLEAIGLPPRTVEIAPDEAEAMRLEEFMGLLAAHFEGRSVAGAPAIGASPEAVTGVGQQGAAGVSAAHPQLVADWKYLSSQVRPEDLVAMLVQHPDLPASDPTTAEHLLVALDFISVDIEKATSLLRAGAAAPLIRMLAAYPALPASSPALARDLLRAVSNLTDPLVTVPFGDGAVAPLARMLINHPNLPSASPDVAEELYAAIGNLAMDSAIEVAFGRAGVAAPLVGLLKAYPDLAASQPCVAEQIYMDIRNLSTKPDNRAAFMSAGVAAPLVRLLIDHPNLPAASPSVAETLLGAISNLAVEPRHRPALGRAGMAAPLVKMLAAHPDPTPGVAQALVLAIGHLAGDPDNRAAFMRAGVFHPLLRVVPRVPTTDPEVTEVVQLCMARFLQFSLASGLHGQGTFI